MEISSLLRPTGFPVFYAHPSSALRDSNHGPAYDVIMKNGIDQKGAILTNLSEFWFTLLSNMIPDLRTHFVSLELPSKLQHTLPPNLVSQLRGRSMVVRRLTVLPIESIVRGYITGSAWASYQKHGTVCEIPMPPHLRESQKLERPLWTPSTKAAVGGTDENISPERGKITPRPGRTSTTTRPFLGFLYWLY